MRKKCIICICLLLMISMLAACGNAGSSTAGTVQQTDAVRYQM